MGTGRKRKNAGVGIDFKKAKHKVGKKLKKARNETDTTIKSQAIHMPGQSLANDKEGKAVTSRNLTLKDLLTQLGHYNAKIRRDALIGLGELFVAHPDELTQHAAMIIEATGEMAIDLDGAVRTQLLKLLSTQIFPSLAGGRLQPFVPLLVAHISSSMTHAAMEVRSDALKFLNELMHHEPGIVTAEFLLDCLEHFGDMCGSLGRSRSLESLSQGAMLKVLNAVTLFLKRVGDKWSAPETGSAGLASSDSPASQCLMSCRCGFPSSNGQQFQAEVSCSEKKKVRDAPTTFERLFSRLLSLLSAGCTGMSEGGGVLTDSMLAIQLTSAAMESIFNLLVLADIQYVKGEDCAFPLTTKSMNKMSKVLASQVCTHFPMTLPDREVELDVRTLVFAFNCGASRLLLRVLQNTRDEALQPTILRPLVVFYMSILTAQESKVGVEDGGAKWNSVLPDMLAVVPLLDGNTRDALLEAAAALCTAANRDWQTKLQVLMLLYDVIRNAFRLHGSTTPDFDDTLAISWLKMIPKIMWEAGSKNPEIARVCLLIVQHLSRMGNKRISQQLGSMSKEFTLMFVIARESKNGTVRATAGPLHKLPTDLQLLAVDVLYYLPSLGDIILKTCLAVCLMSCYPIETCQRFLYAISHAASSGRVSEKALSLLLVGLVTGKFEWDLSQQKLDAWDWRRLMLLCSGACELVCCRGDENGIEMAAAISTKMREGITGGARLKSAAEVRWLVGVMSFMGFVARLGGHPGGQFPSYLPDLVLTYMVAVAEDTNSVFGAKEAVGDELAVDMIRTCAGLFREVVGSMEERVTTLRLQGLSPDTVQDLDYLCHVLLVLMNSLDRKYLLEGAPCIRGTVGELKDIVNDTQLGTEVEGKLREKVGKLGALCEHHFDPQLM